MEIKAALGQARKSQEAQFAKDWQDRLKQLKAEEVRTITHACAVSVLASSSKLKRYTPSLMLVFFLFFPPPQAAQSRARIHHHPCLNSFFIVPPSL